MFFNFPKSFRLRINAALLAAAGSALAMGTARAATDPNSISGQVAALQQQIQALNSKVTALKREQASAVRQIVEETLKQAATESSASSGLTAGYDNGFYLRIGKRFDLSFNGLFQARYTYSHAENAIGDPGTPLGANYSGDMNGFGLPTVLLTASGTLFQHVQFKIAGNFGSTSSFTSPTAGTFQLTDAWAAYNFAPWLGIRAGSMLIPYTPLKGLANYGGSELPDFATSILPFGVGYGLGVDIDGVVGPGKFTYSFMINNGSNSQDLVDSASPVAGVGRDNRLSYYTREQFFGAGTPADFLDEPDLQWHKQLVWVVGAGLGYESQNSSAGAFPGAQSTTKINGLSSAPSPGFLATPYTLNGNLYRATLDFRTKYRGWSLFPAIFYQQINGTGTIATGLPATSVGQCGYFLQSGYFIIPHKWEIAGRFGQLITLGEPNRMEEYTLGVNYYIFGENAKIQTAVTYIPNEAALTNNVGSVVNTQDIYGEIQFQIKF